MADTQHLRKSLKYLHASDTSHGDTVESVVLV